jgi:hypothetical protein
VRNWQANENSEPNIGKLPTKRTLAGQVKIRQNLVDSRYPDPWQGLTAKWNVQIGGPLQTTVFVSFSSHFHLESL